MLHALVIGNLGDNAKIVTGNFNQFVSFNVAHTETFRNRQGVEVKNVQWVNVIVVWDCRNLLPYLVKGAKVFVSGNLKTRLFADKNGNTQIGLDCHASTIQLCGGTKPLDNSQGEGASPKKLENEKTENPFENDAEINQETAF